MRRSTFSPEPDCAIAQSLGVIGDGWELLIVRDLARGLARFDELAGSLHISRKVLTERLNGLLESGIVERSAYQDRPTRYAYELTPRGRALLPVLVALQDWGDRWLLGDGSLTGTNTADEPPAQRLQELVGQRVPYVALPSIAGTTVDVVDADARATVLFGYPATGRPTRLPDGWDEIAGAAGCTLENRLFAGRYDDFASQRIAVRGVSTQRTDEQQAFARAEEIPHLLLSDVDLELVAALRLPTFRAGGYERLKRVVLVVGADRVVQAVRYPVSDIADTVEWALTTA
ncbi:winged helix-turn-helix transcriptional regulator [Kribbella sp. VKM Ac-2566]|uniref:winged helix-turn-helix transcriptional regulator n=1 Tax=Kribbella sp. VKM Ac-2566 TaxID=2512218 RepID=UPI0010636FDC|nr:winged helix-turn-helix transcriptional regulator [Kribbella sp. VKM Ac-2566]TDX03342.1 HxlR family transcriptional regulator [Kribbella sp. VKM Ac-2566]